MTGRQYDILIEWFQARIRQYERMEDWLNSIQQSGFRASAISNVRTHAREERLAAITRQVQGDMAVQRGSWDAAVRPALDILSELDLQDESVYDTVLLACDTAQPGDLESALATVRYCQTRAEQGLRMVPELLARQRRRDAQAAALRAAVSGGGMGAMIGAIGGMLACVGVCVNEGMGAGANTFVVCALIGCALGALIGYVRGHKRASNS